jgi:hypothetical protein
MPEVTFPLARALLLAVLPCASACGPRTEPAPDGQGLVLLPYEGPLGRGVAERDPRLNFHDFGRVRDGDAVTRVFQLRNGDPRPVSITRVDPGCGCTVAGLRVVHADGTVEEGEPIRSKEPRLLTVPPGELAEIEVRIETRDMLDSSKNNDKLITLRVLTDSPNGYFLTLEVHILVEKPFNVVPPTLALGNVPENGGGTGKVDIVQAGHMQHELVELLEPPEGVHAELTREIRNLLPVWVLRAGLEPPLARGPRTLTLRIATEEAPGVPGRELEVPLSATVVGDLTAEPERIVFAAPRGTETRGSVEFHSLLAGHRLRVRGLELPEDQRGFLAASYEPIEADDDGASLRWRITLATVPPLSAEPVLAGRLRLLLDDPQHPSHELEYVVHLR